MESQHQLTPLHNVMRDRVDHESHFDVQVLLACGRMLTQDFRVVGLGNRKDFVLRMWIMRDIHNL